MTDITLVQWNDSHAYLETHPERFRAGNGGWVYRPAGGYARVATLLARIREECRDRVLACDCGDTLHGTYPAVHSRGGALVPLLNELGWAAMTAHWDFAYGPERLEELAGRLDYPLLACNVYRKDSGERIFSPSRIREVGDLRVGICGVASNIVDTTMPESFGRGLRFTEGVEELPGEIERLRGEGVDLVLVLSHLGFPQDVHLASLVPGIDVLFSGHTHNRLRAPVQVGDTILVQAGCHGSFLGRLDLEVGSHRIREKRYRLIAVTEEVPPDPAMADRVEGVVAPHREYLDRVAGETRTALTRGDMLESTMDNFLLQALCHVSGAALAFSNGWRYGAPVLPGPVTENDLWNIIPVNPPVSTVDLTGAEIRTMLEEDLERTFSRNPFGQMGGYVKRCVGLTAYIKVENPPGARIEDLFIMGRRLDERESYPAAFVTTQGVPAGYGSHRRDLSIHAIGAMERYLETGTVEAKLRGTVVMI